MDTPASLGIEKARAQLAHLVEQAQAGHVSVLTRHGKRCAAIVPIALLDGALLDAQRARDGGLLALCGSGKGLWHDDAANETDRLRSEWRE